MASAAIEVNWGLDGWTVATRSRPARPWSASRSWC